jgi:RNA polymerase sigma factor (sigma-70 family)
MAEDEPYLSWLGADDRIVVEEMLRDPRSKQWDECYEFVRKLVHVRAKNIHQDNRNDIVQDAMLKISKSLHTFRYKCRFRTWLFRVVQSCIIDIHRKISHAGQLMTPLDDSHDDIEREGETFTTHNFLSAEDEYIIRDDLREALNGLQEHISSHANAQRNRRILEIVLLEGQSLEEAAKEIGCSAPVAGYVVRSAQRYIRKILKDHQ